MAYLFISLAWLISILWSRSVSWQLFCNDPHVTFFSWYTILPKLSHDFSNLSELCRVEFILEKIQVFLISTVKRGCIWIELGVLTVFIAIWRRFGYLSQGFLIWKKTIVFGKRFQQRFLQKIIVFDKRSFLAKNVAKNDRLSK